ncbi:hypothetical protein FKL08_24345, partial [Klebsiella pneumoniae]|nr:hypothetical protein [Klebsiella pneumoniae]
MNVRFQREVVHGGIPWTRNLVFQIQTIPTGQIASIAAGFCYGIPRFYVSTSKSIIKALINMHSFEIQLS